ncbi:MAG: alpha/beta fold hydrolase [Myxococcales bacterium]|nr:alpha/beta fold hydrolase [Myxococcales bacterium]MCB9748674.1 alpha/beta fold hydrolase [Myxococcales bacterium]
MKPEAGVELRARAVETPRLRQRVGLAGDRAAAEVVLLIHGNLASGRCWEDTQRALASRSRLLVAPDLRGYGGTEAKPVDATRGLREFSEDLQALLETLGLTGRRLHVVGWSLGGNVAMQLVIDRPAWWRSLTLVASGSPYGFGGTRGPDGRPCHPDFAGSGAGATSPAFIECLRRGDRGDASPRSPRGTVRHLLFARSFTPPPAIEELMIDGMLETALGDDHYPGDVQPSANWPGFAPGRRGVNNALSPKYLDQSVIVDVEPKPPVLWIHGPEDAIVSDCSVSEPGGQGARGLFKHGGRAAWPGADVHPPQPMVTQLRAVLARYAAAGGTVREESFAGCGHSPHLERPEEFRALLSGFLGARA